jgi:hypothetical protein
MTYNDQNWFVFSIEAGEEIKGGTGKGEGGTTKIEVIRTSYSR